MQVHLVEQAAGQQLAADRRRLVIAEAPCWPRLVHATWSIDQDGVDHAIAEAARTMVARCTPPGQRP